VVATVTETSIAVRHNIEVAHRLFRTPGKCENIHGHSMNVELDMFGAVDSSTGMLANLDFSDIKKKFRGFLDYNFDHKTLLNKEDPWAGGLIFQSEHDSEDVRSGAVALTSQTLPGLVTTEGDPTTENIAWWIATWSLENLPWTIENVTVTVHETAVNTATCTLAR
jgi:6-pyruvoyl tetrahydropterin synthase/QueD family protein